MKEAYDRVKEREAGELEEEWRLMKESLVGYACVVCGKRFVGGCMRRGSEWWNEGVKMKVEEKKRAFEEWLQCNSVEKYERYREKNVEAKRKVEEAKRMSNFKWGQDFDRSYEENKKEVLEGGEEGGEGWIENGRDSKRCKWTVVKRK